MRHILASMALCIVAILDSRLCAQSLESNEALRKQYIDHQKNGQNLYASTPITHISPAFNTITYSLGADWIDNTITPDTEDPTYVESPYSSASLKLEGYHIQPHLSLSLKNIGLGFTVGRGEKTASYSSSFSSPGTDYVSEQSSKLSFGEVGLFTYFMPFPKIANRIRTTLILGGRSINAKHALSPSSYTTNGIKYTGAPNRTYRYNVSIVEAGLNFRVSLLRRFAIIPWADYNWIDTKAAEAAAANDDITYDEQLRSDMELFWKDEPSLRYGIDFAIRFQQFQINIGGLLGLVIASSKSKESIENDSISISLSFDQKGN